MRHPICVLAPLTVHLLQHFALYPRSTWQKDGRPIVLAIEELMFNNALIYNSSVHD